MFRCFVDYQKAFDKINRNIMISKLPKSGIDCQMLNIIKSLYANIKSCVRYENQMSDFFSCHEGLMQGESLSPFLFSLYVNDFETEFIEKMCIPVEVRDTALILIMYADDCIVLFITKNHTVHRFNVCTRNTIQIENHEYIYQIIAVRDSVPITYFHKSNFHVGTTY